MIELLIVLVIIMVLLALSAPFVTSLRSDVSIAQTLKEVKSDLVATMSYSMAGKSFASLASADGPSPELMPSRYALFFKKDAAGIQNPYYYLETKTQTASSTNQPTQSIYRLEKEMPSPGVFLKSIRLINAAGVSKEVDSVMVFFTPPFGKVVIVDGTGLINLTTDPNFSFNLLDTFKPANTYEKMELDFQYKDDLPTLTTITFGIDKIINVF